MGGSTVPGSVPARDALSQIFAQMFSQASGGLPVGGMGTGQFNPATGQDVVGATQPSFGDLITKYFSTPQYGGQLSANLQPQQLQAMGLSQALMQMFGAPAAQGQALPTGPTATSVPGGVAGGPGGVQPYTGGQANLSAPGVPIDQGGGTPPPIIPYGPGTTTTGSADPIQSFIQSITGGLKSMTGGGQLMPGSLQQLLSNLPGQGLINQASTAQDPISQALAQLGLTPAPQTATASNALTSILSGASPLSSLASMAPSIASTATSGLTNLLNTGGAPNYANAFKAMSDAAQADLTRNQAATREQFSFLGNRFGSDLTNAMNVNSAESQKNLLSQMAQAGLSAAGQQSQTQLGAGQILSQLGLGAAGQAGQLGVSGASALGQLGLGQQGTSAGALGQAGQLTQTDLARMLQGGTALQSGGVSTADIISQLFGGQQNRALTASQALPGATAAAASIPAAISTLGMQQGGTAQQTQQDALTRLLQSYTSSAGALFPSALQFAAGTPIIPQPSLGSQILGAGTTAAAGAMGAK